MITTSSKSGNKDKFWKDLSYRGSIKSSFNIYKFNLCIPISLGVQVQTYVNKNKILKTNKGECNLEWKKSCIISKENVFFS